MTDEYMSNLVQHPTSGEVYAIRTRMDNGAIVKVSGPLSTDEQDALGDEADFDGDDTDIAWATSVEWQHIRALG